MEVGLWRAKYGMPVNKIMQRKSRVFVLHCCCTLFEVALVFGTALAKISDRHRLAQFTGLRGGSSHKYRSFFMPLLSAFSPSYIRC